MVFAQLGGLIFIKYEKCINCPHLGMHCDGPNFMAMEGLGLIEWCKRRKAFLGLSNDMLAELANMAPGTVARIMAGTYENFKYSSVRPLLQVLVGGEWGDHPCVDPDLAARCMSLQEENDSLRVNLATADAKAEARVDRALEDKRRTVDHLKEQIAEYKQTAAAREKTIKTLSTFLAIAVVTLIALLVVDTLLPNAGWFRY